jgi:potassium efflux system protein
MRALVLLLLLASTYAWGQVAPPEVTAAQLDAAVVRVTAALPEDDAQRVALLKTYADTRAALSKYEQFSQQLTGYVQARANAVQEAQAIEDELAQAHQAPPPTYEPPQDVTLAALEQMIQVAKSELDAGKKRLSEIRSAIEGMPGRAVEIRTRVTMLAGLSAELGSQLGVLRGNSGSDRESDADSGETAAWWLASAQFASVNAEKAALEEELLSQPMRLELLKAQFDQTRYDSVQLERRSRAMTQRASELRQGEAAEAQATADLALADAQGKHELVRELADKNAALTKTFSQRNSEIAQADEYDSDVSRAGEQLEFDLGAIEHKLSLLGMSTVVGEILRERQAQLPGHGEIVTQIANNADAIRASSLRQVELEDERRQMRNPAEYIEQLVEKLAPDVAAGINDDLRALVQSRRELLRKAIELENSYAQTLGDLDFALRRYALAVDAYREFISERLLWIPSRDRFGLFHGEEADIAKQIGEVSDSARWITVIKRMPAEVLEQPVTGLLLLLVAVLIYFGPYFKRQLAETGKQVGYVRSDNFASTLHALGLSVLLSVKWPLLMLTVAWLFEMQEEESELATALYLYMARTALYFWGLEFLRIALLPKGLVDAHFRWPGSRVAVLSQRIVMLELTLLPSVFLVGFFLSLYPRTVGGSLGTLAVFLVLLSIAYFFNRLPEFVHNKVQMIFRDKVSTENPFWAKLLRKLLFWIPVAAILAVLLGYTYTAIEIALMLIRTFVLLSCVLILHELGLRWLGLTRRRMAYQMRQEQVKSSSEDEKLSIEDEILDNDPELLNDEGTKLLNLLTLFGGLLGVGWIWAEVFPALRILDTVQLWHQTTVIDGRQVIDPVTLADVFKALLFAAMGWLALRRVPGLFEIFLRQKMKVAAASAYAITRVCQYAFTMLLVIFVVGALGVSWSSLQWAVAALSLGIGFGLQEIVANFISGLIILFEQPIRLGDTVTVGDVSGTVTRIQMRATTIRDFDRRELLVPNKEFITSRLLNWSLSDSVTRRQIQIGVGYSTDIDQALEIVREVAKKHPLVLSDPECLVTFDDFGESSLLISLRYFIEHLDKRLTVDSELRLQISRRFREAGIEIAFPQRDIHIDTTQPLEIRMLKAGQDDE